MSYRWDASLSMRSFAIDEILHYRWALLPGSRTLCHPEVGCILANLKRNRKIRIRNIKWLLNQNWQNWQPTDKTNDSRFSPPLIWAMCEHFSHEMFSDCGSDASRSYSVLVLWKNLFQGNTISSKNKVEKELVKSEENGSSQRRRRRKTSLYTSGKQWLI